MHFHWQNLNEKTGNRLGWGLRAGRCWLHLGDRRRIGFEWNIFQRWWLGAHLETGAGDGMDGWHFGLSVPGLSLYLNLDGFGLPTAHEVVEFQDSGPTKLPQHRQCSISLQEWVLNVIPYGKWGEWCASDPWWIRGVSWDLWTFLFGKVQYSERDLAEGAEPVLIPMPENSYPGLLRIFESSWSCPRWFTKRIIRAKIEVPEGIPYPGKGENSWDCGEQKTFGITCPADTPEKAIATLVESVLNDRRRHGGSVMWRPKEHELPLIR